MGKHETGYARVERDLYPTPAWVIDALAEHLELRGAIVWECACGDGRMAEALRFAGCARVYTTDVVQRVAEQDEVLDFLSKQTPKFAGFSLIITNPPFGKGGKLAMAFIAAGLRRLPSGGMLALLLPADFDSAKTRADYFGNSSHFVGKIVLTKRIVWFQRNDGIREAPKENNAWYLWSRSPLRVRRPSVILYSPAPTLRESTQAKLNFLLPTEARAEAPPARDGAITEALESDEQLPQRATESDLTGFFAAIRAPATLMRRAITPAALPHRNLRRAADAMQTVRTNSSHTPIILLYGTEGRGRTGFRSSASGKFRMHIPSAKACIESRIHPPNAVRAARRRRDIKTSR
jgi:hypothetical protein